MLDSSQWTRQNGDGATTLLVELVMARLGTAVTQGFGPADAAWALAAYREVIVPQRLSVAEAADSDARVTWAKRVADNLGSELAPLEPADKRRAITVERSHALLQADSVRAFDLAQRTYTAGHVDPALAAEAHELRSHLDAFMTTLRANAPAALEAVSFEISETDIDCEYAMRRPAFTSVRLSHWIESVRSDAVPRAQPMG